MEKKCYICLPISGDEKTAIGRASKAAEFVKEFLGLEPLTPMEINEESQDTLDNPERPIEFFMGNDIRALIGQCDSIFVCEGWESSKGCNVEVECAKQYGLKVFYESIPMSMPLKDAYDAKMALLLQAYNYACEKYGPGKPEAIKAGNKCKRLEKLLSELISCNSHH